VSKLTVVTPFIKGNNLMPRCNRRRLHFKIFLSVLDKFKGEKFLGFMIGNNHGSKDHHL
jgi:hypothetical protein